MTPQAKTEVLSALSDALTEERTDALIDWLGNKLPAWSRWAVKWVLDRLLPEALIEGLEEVL